MSESRPMFYGKQQHLFCAFMLGAFAGMITGVLAMAVTILAIAVVELIIGHMVDESVATGVTAVTFVVFNLLGWTVTTILIWRKFKT